MSGSWELIEMDNSELNDNNHHHFGCEKDENCCPRVNINFLIYPFTTTAAPRPSATTSSLSWTPPGFLRSSRSGAHSVDGLSVALPLRSGTYI